MQSYISKILDSSLKKLGVGKEEIILEPTTNKRKGRYYSLTYKGEEFMNKTQTYLLDFLNVVSS